MPNTERDLVDRVVEAFRERTDRIRSDVGHALDGRFGEIKTETQRELAEAIRDSMEGRTRVDIPINERVTLQGSRERDGSLNVNVRINL